MTNQYSHFKAALYRDIGYALLLTCSLLLTTGAHAQQTPSDVVTDESLLPIHAGNITLPIAQSNEPSPLTETDINESIEQAIIENPIITLPHNLSPWGMFVAADWVVKTVMIGLAIASLLTWTVLISKTLELNALKSILRLNLKKITAAHTLADAANADDVLGVGRELIDATEAELQLSADMPKEGIEAIKAGIKERVASSLSRIEVASTRQMMVGTGLLATIGAVAPFVGLFGTVWGIMNSFIGISQSNTTNLAVVAPGIAEALLATALGLVAAIPAVVIYNHFTRQITGAKSLVSDSSAAIMRLLSRDLDRGTHLRVVSPLPSSVVKTNKAD